MVRVKAETRTVESKRIAAPPRRRAAAPRAPGRSRRWTPARTARRRVIAPPSRPGWAPTFDKSRLRPRPVMGRDEVLAEVHFYNQEGVCLGRVRQWSDYREPGCDCLYKVPEDAAYFRICAAYNYSVNCFERETQGFCPKNHALISATSDELDHATSISDVDDILAEDKAESDESASPGSKSP